MSRERTFRSEAIVLRRTDFGEADRLLTLYTREFGKLRAIAKGARKPQSRKTGHVELFMRTNFFFARGRDLDIVTQAEVVETYDALREDLIKTTYAAYAVELLDRFSPEEDRNLGLYDLLRQALGWFEVAEDPRLPARYYELRLLSLVGFQPQLFRCVVTGQTIEEENQFFSAERGGFVTPAAHGNEPGTCPASALAVKVLRYLQSRPWDTVSVLRFKPPLQRELEEIMHFYLTYILERQLKSVDFLYRLRHEAAIFSPKE